MTKKQDYVAIGVDVSSKKLDACILPKNEHQIFENNRKGHKELARWAKKNRADIVLCENTGGYETQMLLALFNADVPVRAYNPKQVKRYIESLGNVAKTDAKRIAMLAIERQPEPLQTMSAESVAFKELLVFYRQRVLERSRLKNQLKTGDGAVRDQTNEVNDRIPRQEDCKDQTGTSEVHCGQRGVESEARDSQISAGHRRGRFDRVSLQER